MHKARLPRSKRYIFGDQSYSKNVRKLRFILAEVDRIHTKLQILFQFSLGPRGLIIGRKFKISCEFVPLQVKWWYHMFSTVKMEEYMESELSGIFRVKLVAKSIVLELLNYVELFL